MSVMMSMGLKVDPSRFEQVAQEHEGALMEIIDKAKQAGVIHHVFCGADGEVMVLDEWPDEGTARGFLESSRGEIQALFADAGVSGEPSPRFWRPLQTADRM